MRAYDGRELDNPDCFRKSKVDLCRKLSFQGSGHSHELNNRSPIGRAFGLIKRWKRWTISLSLLVVS